MNSKLRVGFWVGEHVNVKKETGGGYGYFHQLISAVDAHDFKNGEVIFLAYHFPKNWNKNKNSYELRTKRFSSNFFKRATTKLSRILLPMAYQRKVECYFVRQQIKQKQELYNVVDVIYYPTPSCELDFFPYIYTLWDLGHLSTYSFPELSMNGVFEIRKKHHDIIPHRALQIFCESEAGKRDITKYLRINEDRIKVVPIFPSVIVDDKIRCQKPDSINKDEFFIHYPAQFWSHKNHYNLILAFKILSDKYAGLKLILTGSDQGNISYINDIIDGLNLRNKILVLGFVPIEEIKWLYKRSQALVMPTFLGPTNMPLLEAAELGCPVVCSDFEGHREQLGEYAFYIDPLSPLDIAKKVNEVIEMNQRGIKKGYVSKFNIGNTVSSIDNAFAELKSIRNCWGENDEIF